MISVWWRRLWLFIRRDTARRELEEEMQLHHELRARALENVGLTPTQAATATQVRFGHTSTLIEQSQESWGFQRSDELRWNLRYALRRLRARPAFSASIILVMGLGVGATTAMFSAVDAVVLRALPFREADRLVTLPGVDIPFADRPGSAPPAERATVDFLAVTKMSDVFTSTAAFAAGHLNLRDNERPQRLRVGVVTDAFFRTLGIEPAVGRAFAPNESVPGAPNVLILSDALWRRQYGARSIVGETITVDDQPYQVVGIMPPGFSFPEQSDLWIPMSVPNTVATLAPFHNYVPSRIIARLAPGAQTSTANQRLLDRWKQAMAGEGGPIPPEARQQFLAQLRTNGAVQPLQASLAGGNARALVFLLGATGLLLLIACANVTNLLLADAASRAREIAIRTALGASHARILRQLLIESVVLAFGGIGLGLVLAPVVLRLLRVLLPDELAGVAVPALDWRVLAFSSLLGLVTGAGFGLWPARNATRVDAADTLKSGGNRLIGGRRESRGSRLLITAELALTLALLVGSGLLLRSFVRVLDVDRGMTTSRVGSQELSFASSASSGTRLAQIDAVLDRLRRTPGIESAAAVNDLPLSGAAGSMAILEFARAGSPPQRAGARYLQVSPGYFTTLGIPLKSGRDFTAHDDSLAPATVIINEALARRWFPAVDPVGQHITARGLKTPYTVIGVVADVRELGLEANVTPQLYHPIQRVTPRSLAFVARGMAKPERLLATIRDAVHAVDPTQALGRSRMMDRVMQDSVAPRRTNAMLISLFAGLALVLAAVGVYSVVAHGIAQRTREFGIRAALGATGHDLVGMVSREILMLVALGIAIGLAGAWTGSRVLKAMVYGVSVHDPVTFGVGPALLAVVAMLAAVLPLRRVFRVEPNEVIRRD
jgi:predicted permease